MTNPDVRAQLETILDELDMTNEALLIVLRAAHLSALHSTYTAAIKRIVTFHDRTMQSTQDLIYTLTDEPSTTKL